MSSEWDPLSTLRDGSGTFLVPALFTVAAGAGQSGMLMALSSTRLSDLGLEQFSVSELFSSILIPGFFLLACILQLHYFHRPFMQLTDLEHVPPPGTRRPRWAHRFSAFEGHGCFWSVGTGDAAGGCVTELADRPELRGSCEAALSHVDTWPRVYRWTSRDAVWGTGGCLREGRARNTGRK